MDLSIIVPVYNVEKYIHDCITSILGQVEHKIAYEIIIVNDGSTDNSAEVINKLEARFKRITVLNQENQKQGQARNYGFERASGKYVWFVDSDDWIDSKSFNFFQNLLKFDYDIIEFESADVFEGNILCPRFDRKKLSGHILTGPEHLKYNDKYGIDSGVLTRSLYRREFLLEKKLYQMKGVFHEDVEFAPRAIYYAKTIFILNSILYYIRPNSKSVTRSFNAEKSFDLLRVCKALDNFVVKEVDVSMQKYFHRIIATSLNSSLIDVPLMRKKEQRRYRQLFTEYQYLIKNLFSSYRLKYFILGVILTVFRKNIVFPYKLIYILRKKI